MSFATEDQLLFLDKLRDSGLTNMFGAGPYIVARFGVSRNESHVILGEWMDTFSARQDAKARTDSLEATNK